MRIVTHSGKIHSDETGAIALLSNYFNNKGIEVSVLRTRDSNKFLAGDILVDVGGEYNHEELKYDHHQDLLKPMPNTRVQSETVDEDHGYVSKQINKQSIYYKQYKHIF